MDKSLVKPGTIAHYTPIIGQGPSKPVVICGDPVQMSDHMSVRVSMINDGYIGTAMVRLDALFDKPVSIAPQFDETTSFGFEWSLANVTQLGVEYTAFSGGILLRLVHSNESHLWECEVMIASQIGDSSVNVPLFVSDSLSLSADVMAQVSKYLSVAFGGIVKMSRARAVGECLALVDKALGDSREEGHHLCSSMLRLQREISDIK